MRQSDGYVLSSNTSPDWSDSPASSSKESDEDELEYEYDFRNDCEERVLSDRTKISLGSKLSTSRRLAIVLVLALDLLSALESYGAARTALTVRCVKKLAE
jgi:hypothetical protein